MTSDNKQVTYKLQLVELNGKHELIDMTNYHTPNKILEIKTTKGVYTINNECEPLLWYSQNSNAWSALSIAYRYKPNMAYRLFIKCCIPWYSRYIIYNPIKHKWVRCNLNTMQDVTKSIVDDIVQWLIAQPSNNVA